MAEAAGGDGVVSSAAGDFRLRWDVFLSFRGADTRDIFTKNLYGSLQSRGIRVFLDDDGLDRGDEIAPTLLEAIDDSAASIIVLSPNYASSHWCLEEVAKICDCGRLILPVFYQVDPRDVRKQKGPFEEYFKAHEARFKENIVLKWRESLKKVGGIAGFPFRNSKDEANLIRRLVQRILKELSNTPVGVAEYTVGLDDRIEQVMKLLDIKSNGVRFLGLYGTGGIGKTTIAKSLFNTLVVHFEHRTFISNVREHSSRDGGLVSLRNKVVTDLSKSPAPVNNDNVDVSAIRRTVRQYPVLIVLDDVDDANQLSSLIGKKQWFHDGSRVIITTRDRQILSENHVDVLYEVKELESPEALHLFSYHALRRKEPAKEFMSLSKQIVQITGGLPLALEVFGSFLFDKRRVEEWQDALENKLKTIRPRNLQDVLKISYDALDEEEKCIFLDIACLFVQMQMKREDVVDIVKGCGFGGEITVKVLEEKCLIKMSEDNTVGMHDQVRDMGRQIVVVDENLVDPGMRSRLWNRSEILDVLEGKKGTRSIQGMVLDFEKRRFIDDKNGGSISWNNLQGSSISANFITYIKQCYKKYLQQKAEKEKEIVLHTKCFESMVSLRLLQINNLRLEGKFEFLAAELKWLEWQGCPLKCMPSDFWARGLTVLILRDSKIENLWGWKNCKGPNKLMVMNLSHCYSLAAIPDLSGCESLEKIILVRCLNLTKIHESIGNLIKLHHLDLSHCKSLVELPSDVSGLGQLENLFLSGCTMLKALPKNICHMKSLRRLFADDTAISELPESIFHLTKLEQLVLDGCQYLRRLPNCIGTLCSLQELSMNSSAIEELPNSIGSLGNLEKLSLMWCKSLSVIPDSIGNLISLNELFLNGTEIRELPSSIGSLSYLKELSVGDCKLLRKLPDSIEAMVSVVELQLNGTEITDLPDQIGAMKILRKLEMMKCKLLKSLPESFGGLVALTNLNLVMSNITELPESFGLLENLVFLRLNKCRMLRKLPNSIGNLRSLYHLHMEETAVTELPESFGMLSNLRTLKMAKRPDSIISTENESNPFVLPSSFCKLTLLDDLDFRAWRISGKIPDDFEKLSSLETLDLSRNNFHSLPSSLKGLCILKRLVLKDCCELTSLPSLPSSLIWLVGQNCYSLERIHDLSNLESLQELNLTNCSQLVDIPGLECMKSLRWLFLSGCSACSSTVKKRLSKVALRNLETLSMPGSRIPGWFSGETVSFTKRRNLALKAVIIGVVLSINQNHNIPNIKRDDLPAVVDVEAKVFKSGKPKFNTTLNLRGVPKTNEEHVHLCRYTEDYPLVLFLRDCDLLCVNRRSPPVDEGLELKKSGIHLIFEGDDDYDGNEESVDKSLRSVSEKLAEFFNSCEEENGCESYNVEGNESEDERQLESGMMEGEEKRSSYVTSDSTFLFVVSLFFVLLSWFSLRDM